MNSFPSQQQIVNCVINGIKIAKNNFTFWTADEIYLSYAPQKFLTIHVCQEIAKLNNATELFIEATIADILRCSLPCRNDFREFMKKRDLKQDVLSITLDERFKHKSDNDSVSRVIINIRNGVRNVQEQYKLEINNICKMLEREKITDATLDYGIFAFYLDISNSARKKAQQRLHNIIESFDIVVNSYSNLKSKIQGGEINIIPNIGEWLICCYIIEPNFNKK